MELSKGHFQLARLPLLLLMQKQKNEIRGVDVVRFGAGEPDFDTPEHIKEGQ